MKNRLLIIIGILFMAVSAYMLHQNINVGVDVGFNDATASTQTTIAVTCAETGNTTYVPTTLNLTATPDSAVQTTVWSGGSFTLAMSNADPVNNDSSGSMSANGSAAYSAGYVSGGFVGPEMKVSGLQCTTSANSTVEVTRASDNASLDVSIATYSSSGYQSAKAVSGSAQYIFGGTTALISTGSVSDTATSGVDCDAAQNGEVAIGGQATGACAYSLGVNVDVLGVSADGNETVNFTFTPGT